MCDALKVKVCGITRPEDAEFALSLGADFIGVIGYPSSPRYVPASRWADILAVVPQGKRVWVSVTPEPKEIEEALAAGFDRIQIHFNPEGEWEPCSLFQPSDKIWLAPKLKHIENFSADWLAYADKILVDGYAPDAYGGTGKRASPVLFQSLVKKYPQASFILAGGLSPDNIAEALMETGANFVDVNSGVEDDPGCKSYLKLGEFFKKIG